MEQPLGYRGYRYDAALGWYWLSVRPYDPISHRFLQPDPSGQEGVRSYAYCGDDPVDCADPSGLAGQPGGELGGADLAGVGGVPSDLGPTAPAELPVAPTAGADSEIGGVGLGALGDVGGVPEAYIVPEGEAGNPNLALDGISQQGASPNSTSNSIYSEASFGSSTSKDYKETFFEENPNLRDQVVVHHAVEQQVQTNFPGVVSNSEMHSLENLRGIPKSSNGTMHLSDIRRIWNAYYKAVPNPSKEELLNIATQIDDMYGSQFQPPIR